MKTTFATLALFLIAIATALVGSAYAADGVYSVMNCWQQGAYSINQDCLSTSLVSVERAVKERQQERNLLVWRVDASEEVNGAQRMTLTLKRVVMRFDTNNSTLVFYDSANDADKSCAYLTEAVKKLEAAQFFVDLKNGVPIAASGAEPKFWDDFAQPNDDRERFFLDTLKRLFSHENFRQLFESLAYLDSPSEVAVGDKWTTETDLKLPSGENKKLQWNCRLDSASKSNNTTIAKVTGVGSFELKTDDATALEVKMDGSTLYNTQAGCPIEASSRVTIKVERKVAKESGEDSWQTLTVLQKNNLTIAKH